MNLNNLKQQVKATITYDNLFNWCVENGEWESWSDEERDYQAFEYDTDTYAEHVVESVYDEIDLDEREELDEEYYKILEDYAKSIIESLSLKQADVEKYWLEEQQNDYYDLLDYYDMIGAR